MVYVVYDYDTSVYVRAYAGIFASVRSAYACQPFI